MKEYKVLIERNGSFEEIGYLRGENSSDTRFSYAPAYLAGENPVPISISMPLTNQSFSEQLTRNFFDGLLPEGFTRQTLANRIRERADDYIGMLSIIGRECIGAIMISEDGAGEKNQTYELIGSDLINALASEGSSVSTEILTNTHLSLAGASGKVGLYYDQNKDSWFLPHGTSPSTHIIKQSHVRLQDIVVNEALCMNVAGRCGLDIPTTEIMSTGGKDDGSVLLVSKRFDRYFEGFTGEGFAKVHRLHQEDFAQALGIPAEEKYEQQGRDYMNKMFKLLMDYSANPIEDQLKLFKVIAFNCLIGNTDAHLKNYSVLYSRDLRTKRLSPAYDLLCTRYYKGSSTKLSICINGKTDINSVSYEDLISAASNAGVGRKPAERALDELCSSFEKAVNDITYELMTRSYSKASIISECILQGAAKILG